MGRKSQIVVLKREKAKGRTDLPFLFCSHFSNYWEKRGERDGNIERREFQRC